MAPEIDQAYLLDTLLKLLKTPSPTGSTSDVISLIAAEFERLGLAHHQTKKGALLVTMSGQTTESACAVTAHVDTLGAMVKEIKSNGRLALSNLGGYYAGSVVGEYCLVETAGGQRLSGTVVQNKQSVHIHSRSDVHASAESLDTVEIRLDAKTSSKSETEALGIGVGDFVSWDPRAQVTETGFVKSRHLDDKASAAAIVATAEALVRAGVKPARTTYLYFSTYEEVGHGGASGIPNEIDELLVVDIGIVGEGQASDEFAVSICPKDGGGPYDLTLRRKLVSLAEAGNIPYQLDIFINYASDGTAAWRAGADYRVGLIGPGIDSSHAYERTHQDSLNNTARLIARFLQAES